MGDDHAPSPLPGPQPSLSPAQQHLESPVPSAPEALAGGPTQAAPGVRGEEEEWAREIGAQLRRMADDLNAQYERRVSAGRRAGGEGTARPRQMCRSCWPSARGVAPGTSRWGCVGGGIGRKLGSGMGRIGSGAPGRVGESCSELRRGPESAAAGTEGGARRGGSYIPGYL